MRNPEELEGETVAQGDLVSRLSEASRRINISLDLETVLQGALDGARILTGARYGVIVTTDEQGGPADLVTAGLNEAQRWGVEDFPEGLAVFAHLLEHAEPLRIGDLPSHVRALGLPQFDLPVPVTSLLGTSLRDRGEALGIIYVARGEAGREFTLEEEEILGVFASQAALVIANALAHREERRARARMETLVNTAPVGVLVFNAGTGSLASINREARRIVSGLHDQEGSAEQVLDMLSYRRADGREVSLEETPLALALRDAETVRAEEFLLYVPDGRSVTTLVNATPIRSEEGEVESVVVTLQDMTPLEEMERLRAEFLAMVSHELRMPLATIKGSTTTLLNAFDDLDPAEMRQFLRIIDRQADDMRDLISDLLDVAHIETGTLAVDPEPTDAGLLVDVARNRFISADGRDNLRIDIPPDLPRVFADRRRIVQVLGNLLSNAARHSLDSSVIRVATAREGVHVAFSVADMGRGISAEQLPHLFRKFSRLEGEDGGRDLEGSGLGLAICRGIVEAHGGRIRAESDGPGLGSRFTFTLPAVEEAASVAAPPPPSLRRSRGQRPKVLCVDDDPQTLWYVRDALAQSGYDPIVTADPQEVTRLMVEEEPHLVLLDLMLPGSDGMALMKDILAINEVPVIFLSAYGRDEVIASAFDMGAADYVVKPFSQTELAARIRAALREYAEPELLEPSEPFVMGDLTIDYAQRRATVAGHPVELTAIEYRMLVELSVNAGRVLTHDHLLRRVWGQNQPGDSGPVRNIVTRLRRKLGDDAQRPTYILTAPRVGYIMGLRETEES